MMPHDPEVHVNSLQHDERRSHRRRQVVWRASLAVNGHQLACWVRNVSPGGALIELELPIAAGAAVRLEAQMIMPLPAVIAWTSGVFHGLSFLEPRPKVIAAFGSKAQALGFVS